MKSTWRTQLNRRNMLIAGGTGAAAIIALSAGRGGEKKATLVGDIDPGEIRDLGGGLYLSGGWVLTASDLEGIDLSAIKPAPTTFKGGTGEG